MDRPLGLLWLEHDLRLHDNPALVAACAECRALVPVFVWDEAAEDPWLPGAVSRQWLAHSLRALAKALGERGSDLVLRRGPCEHELAALARAVGATRVYWNRRGDPFARVRDRVLIRALEAAGATVWCGPCNQLYDLEAVRTRSGEPFRVFTPFWRACLALGGPDRPLPAPDRLPPLPPLPAGSDHPFGEPLCDALKATGALKGPAVFPAIWQPGEAGALTRLQAFLENDLAGYGVARDRPLPDATSHLSPHLRWGEVSARTVWHAVNTAMETSALAATMADEAGSGAGGADRIGGDLSRRGGGEAFLRQLGWREFCRHLLEYIPTLITEPLAARFGGFPWMHDPVGLSVWQTGRTGYPLVDAGMRQLNATGRMPNRVRMVAASFLVKHLLLPWLEGAGWFWYRLADADLALNAVNWQWVAGCGPDASPFVRIFNPVSQSRTHDPEGAYIRRWVPELARLRAPAIHAPWRAAPLDLSAAGVIIGRTYPAPIIDHDHARRRALAMVRGLGGEGRE